MVAADRKDRNRGPSTPGSRAELDAVEAALRPGCPADAPAGLGEAMRYGVLDGGKRLRPLLVLAACARPCG
jgi:geranylgeranyl pyrophosphate synthase